MAVSTIKTTQMTWGFLNSRLNREPIDSSSLNNSYTDLLWELNQVSSTYEIGKPNTGGSSNFYVGLITAVPYVNKGNGNNENPNMKGPWYVTYCGTDANEGTGKFAFTGHIDDKVQAANTYYADRIVLKRELDYSLEKNTVSPLLLGTYYTGVGHWYDSYTKAKEYAGKELPDDTYFPTTSYAEIFNDYTNNVATGNFAHAEGKLTKANGEAAHAEGIGTNVNALYGHAEGHYTTVSADDSHAEGNSTTVSGEYAHVEGLRSNVTANAGHAEGINTTVSAIAGHAEGNSTIASGKYSHAEGNSTKATNESEHASGKFNISDSSNTGTLFTIGNGTEDTKRHNVIGIYNNGDVNIEGQNITSHNTGYFKTTVDTNHIEIVKGDYTQTIGSGTNNHNITIKGNYKLKVTGATYEGYDSTFISTTKGFKSSYAYDSTFSKTNLNSYNYVEGNLGTYVKTNITERSDTSVYLSSPKICLHGDPSLDTSYIDISSNTTYLYGRNDTYIGKTLHDSTTTNIWITGNKVDKNTITNKETITGTSTIDVTGKTTFKTGSLEVTSGQTNLNLNNTHVHTTNELCLKSSTDANIKGLNNTYLGQDFEKARTTNVYVVSTSTGNITSPIIELNAGNKYTENIGVKKSVIGSTLNEEVTGATTIANKSTRNVTVGKHDSLVVEAEGRTEKITGEKITQVISGNINAYTDDTHDTRLNTRSTYIETTYAYIGDKTNTSITGKYSVGLGQGIKTSSNTNVSVGKYNKDEVSYFSVGIGTSDANRKNAFWISQGNTSGTNGVAYFSNNTYVYANNHDPGIYPEKKDEKEWSNVVTYAMYRNSYTYLYKTINDKFDTFGNNTYFTKSIDNVTNTPLTNTVHYTSQKFDNKNNSWPTEEKTFEISNAKPGALENDNSGSAGLMTARDKARLDSIWEGDKQIANLVVSTGIWTVYKNDGTTTYTITNIKHATSSLTSASVEYGFKVKWKGKWKWTVNNQKNAERCTGTWGETLPKVNEESDFWESNILFSEDSGIASQTIYAAKRGLIISGYPDNYAASLNGSKHLGSIVPASGEDNRSLSVSWNTYRLLFYGKLPLSDVESLNPTKLTISNGSIGSPMKITSRSWNIKYIADSTTCFYMAYPEKYGDISLIKKNGVEVITTSFRKIGTFNYVNGADYSQKYNVYASGVGTANMSISIS